MKHTNIPFRFECNELQHSSKWYVLHISERFFNFKPEVDHLHIHFFVFAVFCFVFEKNTKATSFKSLQSVWFHRLNTCTQIRSSSSKFNLRRLFSKIKGKENSKLMRGSTTKTEKKATDIHAERKKENAALEKYINENKSMTFIVAVWCNTDRRDREWEENRKKWIDAGVCVHRSRHRVGAARLFCIFPICAPICARINLRSNRNNATQLCSRAVNCPLCYAVLCCAVCPFSVKPSFRFKSRKYTLLTGPKTITSLFFCPLANIQASTKVKTFNLCKSQRVKKSPLCLQLMFVTMLCWRCGCCSNTSVYCLVTFAEFQSMQLV